MTLEHLLALPARERDAMVAEKVIGWPRHEVRIKGSTDTVTVWTDNPAIADGVWSMNELRLYGTPPEYSTEVDADYAVLVKVRETWATEAKMVFARILRELWGSRPSWCECIFNNGDLPLAYLPGDYALASLAALEEAR